ncbi:MAG: anhydro-N-acetylmuramic acid kinase [Gemmataceae bacterium]
MRLFLGLSVGSGLEGIDAAAVRAAGVGLELSPVVAATVRVGFPLPIRDAFRANSSSPGPDFTRHIADTAIHAVRHLLTRLAISARDVSATGFLEPSHAAAGLALPWPEIADRIAEQTGITVIHGFRDRDRAVGGAGHPIAAVSDFLLFRDTNTPRLLTHLGSVTSLLFIPLGAKVSNVVGFESGPGNQLLDSLIFHGTKGKELIDAGGKKAVQGKCLESLMERWLEHPHLTRTPPKAVHSEAFGRSFIAAAFESARQLGASLHDLLCTATHLVARSVGHAVKQWLPPRSEIRQVLVSGGGARNGFLWQLVSQQFPDERVARMEEVGIAPQARNAAGAAVLGILTCDGVAGNLPNLTGATGGRLLGHFTPGDGRNWARLASWIADQTGEYPRANRAA